MGGGRFISGRRAYFAGSSKAVQNGIFLSLKLHCPNVAAV